MARSWRVRLMLLIVVMLTLAGFGGYWAVAAMMRASATAPFKAHLAEYLAPTVGPGKAAPARGKMVVVDKNTQDIDSDVFFGLPDGLRASRPEEVGTVVWLEYGRERGLGTYGKDHLPSFTQTCKVTVIDQASRSVIATALLHGGAPPQNINEGQKEGVGPLPTPEVIAYLKGLPRQ